MSTDPDMQEFLENAINKDPLSYTKIHVGDLMYICEKLIKAEANFAMVVDPVLIITGE